MILFINACVRKESRTKALADYVLSKRNEPYSVTEEEILGGKIGDNSFIARVISKALINDVEK